MKKLLSLALGAVVAAAAPAVAQAEASQSSRSVEVTYEDLDLNTQAGAAQLAKRVKHAARNVCGVAGQSAAQVLAVGTCRVGAFEAAQPQMELALDRARRGTVEVAGTARGISVSAGGGR